MTDSVHFLDARKQARLAAGDEPVILSAPLELAAGSGTVKVDREAGLIRGVAIMSVGPAKNKFFEIDQQTLETTLAAWKANKTHIKSRLTHPERANQDGALFLVGRPESLRIEGKVLRGDIRLGKYAKNSPQGNLFDYLMDIAETDPGVMGLSVVAKFDFEEVVNRQTGMLEAYLARTKALLYVDFTDDAAANRQGMLSGQSHTEPTEGEEKMNARQRALLVKLGLKNDATLAEAKDFAATLSADNKTAYEALSANEGAGDDDDEAPGAGGAGEGDDTALSAGGAAGDEDDDAAPSPSKIKKPDAGDGGTTALSADQRTAERRGERERIAGLHALSSRLHLPADWAQRHVTNETSLTDARSDALEQVAIRNAPVHRLSGARVTGGDDGRDTVIAGLTDALVMLSGSHIETPHARAQEYMGLTMREQFTHFLSALGVNTRKMGPKDIWDACMGGPIALCRLGVGEIALSNSSSDFPALLANVQNKILLEGYDEEPSTWQEWAAEMEIKDFKPARLNVAGATPVPPKVLEGAEYTYVSMGEKYETITLAKYGQLLQLTWEAFVNDDLGTFTGDTADFGGACRELEGDLAYAALITPGTSLEDSVAFFHATHNNLNAVSQGAPTIARISGMRAAMRKQRGKESKSGAADGRRMTMRPEVVLVPELLADSTMQLFGSTVDITKNNATPNYRFVQQLKIVADPRLDENSTAAWYALAGKRKKAFVVGFLRGFRRPYVTRENAQIQTDGVVYKVRHVVAAAQNEWRAAQKNAG